MFYLFIREGQFTNSISLQMTSDDIQILRFPVYTTNKSYYTIENSSEDVVQHGELIELFILFTNCPVMENCP